MGRGSGAGGGSHSSSGRSFSGGHSFSGRSGGGGSSAGRGSGAGGFGSFGRSPEPMRTAPPPPPPRPHYHDPYMHDRTVIIDHADRSGPYNRTVYVKEDTGNKAIHTIVTLLILMVFMTIAVAFKVNPTTAAVEKLPSTACKVMDYDAMIIDNLGWIKEDGSSGTKKVKQSLEYFYKKTGVQPMFVLSDTLGKSTASNYSGADIEAELESIYTDTFGDDEGHMIFAVLTNDGADKYSYISCLAGTMATQVMGDAQKETLYDAWDKQWMNLNQSEAEMVANTFENAADKIMAKPSNLMRNIRNICILLDVVLLVTLIIMSISNNKTKRLEEENRHTETVNEQYMKETRSADSTLSAEDNDLLNKYT